MKKLSLFVFITFISIGLFAGFVPRQEAEKVAKSAYFQNLSAVKSVEWEQLNVDCLFDPAFNSEYGFYVFNINGDQGFIIISSDDKITPVLAYSFDDGFNHNNMSPAQTEFLKYFSESIEWAKENDYEIPAKISDEWSELLNFHPSMEFKTKSTSPVLLKNINWNQTWPYNAQCPADPNGINGHVPVGCVATSMLQVMKYYNWPPSGEGSKYHPSFLNGYYGNITINFAQQTYDWNSIPNKASTYVNPELGKVNFHAGVAVSMEWGPQGSGSFTQNVATALESYFKYASNVQFVRKSSYTETNWKNLIKAQIDANKPVVYAGNSTTTGHAWNCDGYQGDDQFRMNWGWGGAGNGYYTLTNLTSSATPGGAENNFNLNQDMVINIYPRDNYPEYCSGTKVITGLEGSFNDGSSINDYQSNSSCVYVIKPECGASVQLNFDDFNLGAGDEINIYDGDEESSIRLETFDADNAPGTGPIYGTRGALTIRFDTDASSNSSGWEASYSVKNCRTNILYTETAGSFSDGSGTCEYANSTVCSWIIEPAEANTVTIDFTSFDMGDDSDWVKIYKNSGSTANLIAELKQSSPPTEPIVVPSGRAFIQFYANASGTGNGWELNYTSSLSNIDEFNILSNLAIVPNPGSTDSRLIFSLSENADTKIIVTNILGEIVAVKDYAMSAGTNQLYMNDIFKLKPEAGLYFVNIGTGPNMKTQKFVVIE